MKIEIHMLDCSQLQDTVKYDAAMREIGSTLEKRVLLCKNEIDRRRRLGAYLLLQRAFVENVWERKNVGCVADEMGGRAAQEIRNGLENRNAQSTEDGKWNSRQAGTYYRQEKGGKPYLEGIDDFYFNLSHSGDCAICGIARQPIGVDVQMERELHGDLAKRFFSEKERVVCSQAQNDAVFFQIWSAKEACVKCTGEGLASGISKYEVDLAQRRVCDNSEEHSFAMWNQSFCMNNTCYYVAACSKIQKESKEILDVKLEWRMV